MDLHEEILAMGARAKAAALALAGVSGARRARAISAMAQAL